MTRSLAQYALVFLVVVSGLGRVSARVSEATTIYDVDSRKNYYQLASVAASNSSAREALRQCAGVCLILDKQWVQDDVATGDAVWIYVTGAQGTHRERPLWLFPTATNGLSRDIKFSDEVVPKEALGTGYLVDKDKVATASHVVSNDAIKGDVTKLAFIFDCYLCDIEYTGPVPAMAVAGLGVGERADRQMHKLEASFILP